MTIGKRDGRGFGKRTCKWLNGEKTIFRTAVTVGAEIGDRMEYLFPHLALGAIYGRRPGIPDAGPAFLLMLFLQCRLVTPDVCRHCLKGS